MKIMLGLITDTNKETERISNWKNKDTDWRVTDRNKDNARINNGYK